MLLIVGPQQLSHTFQIYLLFTRFHGFPPLYVMFSDSGNRTGRLVDSTPTRRHIRVHRVNVLTDIIHTLLPAAHLTNWYPMIQIDCCNSVH